VILSRKICSEIPGLCEKNLSGVGGLVTGICDRENPLPAAGCKPIPLFFRNNRATAASPAG